jgi:hypothetical protein
LIVKVVEKKEGEFLIADVLRFGKVLESGIQGF